MSNETTQDFISALPDSLLITILSLLKIEDVLTTSVLSKRWQYIWTSVPILSFRNNEKGLVDVREFVSQVNRTLLRYWNCNIKRLIVEFNFYDVFASDVDTWARFATEKKVGDLSLHFRHCFNYQLPQFVYCNSFLMNLSIRGCVLVPKIGLRWTCLKNLSIASVKLRDDSITNILSGSPMLEHLRITRCQALDNYICINSGSMKELTIENSCGLWSDDPCLLDISAPNLQSLHILGDDIINVFKFELMSVSSTLQIEHNFSLYSKDGLHQIEFLESLRHVSELELGEMCIWALAPLLVEGKTLSSPLMTLTCLTVNAFIDKQVAAGIISLLRCSPNIEKLVLKRPRHVRTFSCSTQVEEYWESGRLSEKFPLPRLKPIKCRGFKKLVDAGEFTLTLVQVLLESAGFLDMIP